MLFNSLDFAVFLPLIFFLYWFVFNKTSQQQNLLTVVASYFFYSWWDLRFAALMFLSTLVDYFIGNALASSESERKKKLLLRSSIIVNLSILGFFKYYNFFLDNFITAFSFFGTTINSPSLSVVLPIGISFYTFQTISYSIDIYRKTIKPTKDFIAFTSFVSFFPQLIAGPIERAKNLLPQFYKKRTFNYNKAVDGTRQILWGLFKKIVIADNCATYVNLIFNNSTEYNGSTLALGALLFTVQIYADFSGYSDIAIGTARLFGINLSRNFHYPYFSRNFAEAWSKWHISLTTWFRDYLFIPLARKSKKNTLTKVRNIFILFLTIGLWHGANWTFIAWGALHAIYFIPTLFKKNKYAGSEVIAKGKKVPSINDFLNMVKTFTLVVFSMIFFRSENITHAISYIDEVFSASLFSPLDLPNIHNLPITLILISLFFLIEWIEREEEYAFSSLGKNWKKPFRYAMYYSIVILIALFGNFETNQFIYFQF